MITSTASRQSSKTSQAKLGGEAKGVLTHKIRSLLPRVLASAILLALLLWVSLALLSFDAGDTGWSHISSTGAATTNLMGSTGALTADVLLTLFGFAAWLVPVLLLRELINQWWSDGRVGRIFRLLAGVFCLLGGASLLSLAHGFLSGALSLASGSFLAGGVLGTEIALGLTAMMGQIAAACVAALVFLFTFTFAFDVKWRAFARSLAGLLDNGVNLEQYKAASMTTAAAVAPATSASPSAAMFSTSAHHEISQPAGASLPQHTPSAGLSANTVDKTLQPIPDLAPSSTPTPARGGFFARKKAADAPVSSHVTVAGHTTGDITSNATGDLTGDLTGNAAFGTGDADGSTGGVGKSNYTTESASSMPDALQTLGMATAGLVARKSANIDDAQPDLLNIDVSKMAAETPAVDVRFRADDASHQYSNPEDNMVANSDPDDLLQALEVEVSNPTVASQPAAGNALSGNALAHIEKLKASAPSQAPNHLPDASSTNNTNVGKSRAFATAEHRASLSPIPSIELLDKPDPTQRNNYSPQDLARLSELLEIKLGEFNVSATVVDAQPGPVVTRFEVDLAAGVKASKVVGIARDLARSLSMPSLRVVEVIPGKPYIGIEIPNESREMVRLHELLDTTAFANPSVGLSMAIGKDISGRVLVTDLAKAPHLLVAGTTGSGKSVAVNTMLLSMLLKYTPDELRLILIDPKQLELANYSDIPHLLTPVVTDMKDAASALNWCVQEMERRYKLMAFLKVRKLADYNKKLKQADKRGEDFLDPLWRPNDDVSTDKAPRLKPLPAIVVIADEFADMIMQVGKQAEELITRLAQKSRAAGIHLILATQRPSVDVITGLIKANIPTRMALRVNSKVDSRTILDQGGAEDMLGNGDMLFLGPGKIEPERAHGAFVSDDEVNTVCDAWRERGSPDYVEDMLNSFDDTATSGGDGGGSVSGETDSLYDEAVAFIMETRKVSASSIQRKFSIGYNRAARIVDAMEEAGIVSPMDKGGKREILM